MIRSKFTKRIVQFVGGGILAASFGCSGGSTTRIEGQVVDAPVAGAKVSVFLMLPDGSKGELLAEAIQTSADGHFSIEVAPPSGPVLIESRGGSFRDWATSQDVQLGEDDILRAVLPEVTGETAKSKVTPLTHIAAALTSAEAAAGLDVAAAARSANSRISAHFRVENILETEIPDPTDPASAGQPQAALDHAFVLAGLANYAAQAGLESAVDVAAAAAQDALDGVLDGMNAGAQIKMRGSAGEVSLSATAFTQDLGAAIQGFVDSAKNASGGRISDAALSAIATSTGSLPVPETTQPSSTPTSPTTSTPTAPTPPAPGKP